MSESEGECCPWLNLEIRSQISHTIGENLRKIKFIVYKYSIVKVFMPAISEFTFIYNQIFFSLITSHIIILMETHFLALAFV